jgi:hypothetical protein
VVKGYGRLILEPYGIGKGTDFIHSAIKLNKKESIMLTFTRDHEGNFIVTETIMGFTTTDTKVVTYGKDMRWSKVNNDPQREMTFERFQWFMHSHLKGFMKAELQGSGITIVKNDYGYYFKAGYKESMAYSGKVMLESLQKRSFLSEAKQVMELS